MKWLKGEIVRKENNTIRLQNKSGYMFEENQKIDSTNDEEKVLKSEQKIFNNISPRVFKLFLASF